MDKYIYDDKNGLWYELFSRYGDYSPYPYTKPYVRY